jgi:hypothetical protein
VTHARSLAEGAAAEEVRVRLREVYGAEIVYLRNAVYRHECRWRDTKRWLDSILVNPKGVLPSLRMLRRGMDARLSDTDPDPARPPIMRGAA